MTENMRQGQSERKEAKGEWDKMKEKNCKLKNRAAEKERGEREPGSKLRSWKNGLDKVIETKKDKSKKEGRAEEKVKERQRLDKRDKWRSRREEDS